MQISTRVLPYLEDIKEAIDEKDTKKLETTAHYFSGHVNYFSKKIADITSRLEIMGRNGDLTEAIEIFLNLKKITEQLVIILLKSSWEFEP